MQGKLYTPAGGGCNGKLARQTLAEAPPPSLSPMRVARAEALIEYLHGRGDRVLIGPRRYRELENCGVPPHAVDQAIEDLYAHGLADVRMAGGMAVVRLKRRWYVGQAVGGVS